MNEMTATNNGSENSVAMFSKMQHRETESTQHRDIESKLFQMDLNRTRKDG